MYSIRKFFFTWFCTSLDRYFYSQLLLNYVIGVMFFSSIVMINEFYFIIRYYFNNNVPLFHVMSMFGALIPFLISFSIPFGVLPAYLLLMGQLSQDSEIVAMRSCGISQFRIMLPGVVFGVFIMIFAFNFKDHVETDSNMYYIQLKSKVMSQRPVVQLLDNVFLNIGSSQISFERIETVEGSEEVLHNVYAVDVINRQTIRAEEGRIYVNQDNPEHYVMKFLRGDINQLTTKTNHITNATEEEIAEAIQYATDNPSPGDGMGDIVPVTRELVEEFYLSSFGSMTMHNYVWVPNDNYNKSADTYKFNDLRTMIDTNTNNILNRERYTVALSNKNVADRNLFTMKYLPYIFNLQTEDEEDKLAVQKFLSENVEQLQKDAQDKNREVLTTQNKLPNYNVMKLYDKIALPFIALIFAILSLPLGMFSARSGRGEGLSISLVIVLVFYGFKSAIENFISQNKLPPEFVWLPSICFGVVALTLYIRKLNE